MELVDILCVNPEGEHPSATQTALKIVLSLELPKCIPAKEFNEMVKASGGIGNRFGSAELTSVMNYWGYYKKHVGCSRLLSWVQDNDVDNDACMDIGANSEYIKTHIEGAIENVGRICKHFNVDIGKLNDEYNEVEYSEALAYLGNTFNGARTPLEDIGNRMLARLTIEYVYNLIKAGQLSDTPTVSHVGNCIVDEFAKFGKECNREAALAALAPIVDTAYKCRAFVRSVQKTLDPALINNKYSGGIFSARYLKDALSAAKEAGLDLSHTAVCIMLKELGYRRTKARNLEKKQVKVYFNEETYRFNREDRGKKFQGLLKDTSDRKAFNRKTFGRACEKVNCWVGPGRRAYRWFYRVGMHSISKAYTWALPYSSRKFFKKLKESIAVLVEAYSRAVIKR